MEAPNKQLVTEWVNHPVTRFIKKFILEVHEEVLDERGLNALVQGNPQATQENLVRLDGSLEVYRDVIDIFEGNMEVGDVSDEDNRD